jgi:hypothetical protein
MKKIKDYLNSGLKWVEPSMIKKEYELRSGEEAIAFLKFRSSFGTMATGESGDGCWTFKRTGFFKTKITIRKSESETEVGTFINGNWNDGGTLEVTDGRKLFFTTNFWNTKLDLKDENENVLMTYHTKGLLKTTAELEISKTAERIYGLPWIIMLGWYLIIMMHEESAAAAATTAVM